MGYKNILFTFLFVCVTLYGTGQGRLQTAYVKKENAPEHIVKQQKWWNLLHYDIELTPDYEAKRISGSNSIRFSALEADSVLQLDLHDSLQITRVTWNNRSLSFARIKAHTYMVVFPVLLQKGEVQTISVDFEGRPVESVKPPYDNGWIWAKDAKGRPFISVACQGSGASIWLPCKDVLYDEPDNGIGFSITVHDTLVAVSNGRLTGKIKNHDETTTYVWKVLNPIENYCIIPYIGKYVTWHEDYMGINGKLDRDFWVLDYNLTTAKRHFKQTDTLLKAFEYWAGPYPFYNDGFKVVEAPMSGMEHQTALAYGNGFQNGLNGKDIISQSGWGYKFDFILAHEGGHEWFGNSITCSDGGDSWIHEGFAKYFESIYTSYSFGVEAGNDYSVGTWKRIKNDVPILGNDTNDKYYKAAAMLHMIRQCVGDSGFRKLLIGLNSEFHHQTVNTKQLTDFINLNANTDFSSVFTQYLTTTQVPELEYYLNGTSLMYRWNNCVDSFSMPLKLSTDGKQFQLVYPTTQWQRFNKPVNDLTKFSVDRNFYVTSKNASNN